MTETRAPVREVRSIRTKLSRHWLGDDDILRTEDDPDVTIDLEQAKAEIAAIPGLSGGRRLPLLVYLSKRGGVTSEARAYYESEETERVLSAAALIQTSRVAKMVSNLFLKLKKMRYPLRLFTDEDEALAWLKGFLPK